MDYKAIREAQRVDEINEILQSVHDTITYTFPNRRERIAAAVLAGFAQQASIHTQETVVAEHAVKWADALIRVLDGEREGDNVK